ncbi:type II toxin-antitoxin system RelE family toxin [Dolichospermum circinale]|uniref:type II toxin-antitoxin system RelE/ParE family toxin n=1 Tax=Dolichospermum circinale TaxID=109265 RepID=UPI000428448A|nr:type II toxin-antitoxin system RelE/ParE family toxin [Dolichospermum circinale]MDB9458145.1 type II toxin-antitoxin system RelE/ParE family toxin [Dolichospermum circinale CS-545/17]MDB9468538.1 type II toxin-antitoxin system RelE/ParE family toxin [Dolichospermum circinale CS-539/09]MDB9470770.1 type II toxin-antitoxin system RelE/ParE family toxin [Dolichospermum circinale CS-539]
MNNINPISIQFSPEFEKQLHKLSKRYRKIRDDIEPVILQLQKGEIIGDRFIGLGEKYQVYKVRVKNSNIQKGKSGGYRLIYYLKSATNIILLTVYSKSDQEDIAVAVIQEIIEQVME